MTNDTKNNTPATFNADHEQSERPHTIRVGITQGDTNGIGWELILRTFLDTELLTMFTPVVYGHPKVAAFHRKALGVNTSAHIIVNAEDAIDGKLNFVSVSDDDVKVEFGKTCPEAGHAAFLALDQAIQDLKMGSIDVLVTAPINKASIQSSNFRFVGHTEYLQSRLGERDSEALMILCNDLMRVALVTTHLPVSEISMAISQEAVERKARMLYESLRRDFGLSAPRIAVLSLNPHSGDQGLLGHEEIESIIPAVSALSEVGIPCFGPYAADGFFGKGLYTHFDGILAMYHDQGLIPFKALSTGSGVNFTAGLPFVRTSPDHGTAYDIAGRGLADLDSFRQSIFKAIDIYRNRKAHDEACANPLPKLFNETRDESVRHPHPKRERDGERKQAE